MKDSALPAAKLREQMGFSTGERQEKPTPATGFEKKVKKELETPEGVIQSNIIARLVAYEWLTVRVNGLGYKDKNGFFVKGYIVAVLNTYVGFPDIMASHRSGRFLLIECKRESGELTPAQEKFHKFAESRGIPVHVLRDPQEVEGIL